MFVLNTPSVSHLVWQGTFYLNSEWRMLREISFTKQFQPTIKILISNIYSKCVSARIVWRLKSSVMVIFLDIYWLNSVWPWIEQSVKCWSDQQYFFIIWKKAEKCPSLNCIFFGRTRISLVSFHVKSKVSIG